jgi:DNA polymerase-3 subunit beta
MITVKKSDLVRVSNRCSMFVSKKPILPALANFKIVVSDDKISVTGSDQQSWITSSCLASGAKETQSFCVPALRFNAIINVMNQVWSEEDVVSITVHKTKIVIKSGDSKHDLPLMDANEFPIISSVNSDIVFTEKGKVVNAAFRNLTKLVGDDNDKAQLEGIYFQYDSENKLVKMSGGNAVRLCLCSMYAEKDLSGMPSVLIHHAAVRNMEKIFDAHSEISIKTDGKLLSIKDHSTEIVSRGINEKFPDMWKIFAMTPKQANIKMSTVDLMHSINEARIHKSEMNMISSMIINEDSVKLEMVNNEEASYSESYIRNVSGTFIPAKLGLHIDGLKDSIEATNSISVELVYGSNNGKTSGVVFNVVDSADYGLNTSVLLAVYKPATQM